MKITILSNRPVGKKCYDFAVQNFGLQHSIRLVDDYDSFKEDDLVISVKYDKIIQPEEFVEGVKYYNFHPAILPEYAGSSCISWAIINREKTTGVTLHELSEGVDTGGIIDVLSFRIDDSETAEEVAFRMSNYILILFQSMLKHLISGEVVVIPQDVTLRKEYKKKDLEEVKDLTRFVRALTFEGKESAYFYTRDGNKVVLNYNEGAK